MTPEALAVLHARCFKAAPRPWTAGEFAALLGLASTIAILAPGGLALGRVAADEAELLTLAVAPEARRRGLGARLLGDFEAAASGRGAGTCFLEVAEGNPAAALYHRAGYLRVGLRPGYYALPGRHAIDAHVMRKQLQPRIEKPCGPGKSI